MHKKELYTINFVLITLSTFALFTSFYFLLVTLPLYVLKLGGSKSEIGLIIGVFTISAVLSRPHLGRAVDTHGRKTILIAGLLIFLVCMLLYNYTTNVISLLMLRVFHGIGWGAATTAAITLIADIAPMHRRGEAMGVYGMAANVAMAIGPILGVLLLNVSNFFTLFIVCGVIALISLLLILPVAEITVEHPKTSLFSRKAIFPAILMFIFTLTYGSLVSFLPLFTQERDIQPSQFFTYLYGFPTKELTPAIFFTVFAITVIFVRVVAGKISDIKGRGFVIIPGMLSGALGLLVLSKADSLWLFLIAAVIYGLGFGSVHPAVTALLVDRVDEHNRGAAMGTFSAAFDLGIGTGAILLGIVLQLKGFTIMYSMAGMIVLIGAIWFIAVKNDYIYKKLLR